MSWKLLVVMLIFAIGLPAFIIYSIFFQNSVPEIPPIPGFDDLKSRIESIQREEYKVLSVHDEGGAVRVNVLVPQPFTDRSEAQIQTMNALYDLQTIAGRELSISVWTYTSDDASRSSLQGMAFFHAFTEITTFKSPEELQ